MSVGERSLARRLAPGTLWSRVRERGPEALANGALQPIPTRSVRIESGGVSFLVRVMTGLDRKPRSAGSDPGGNPFLPYDPAFLVTEISDAYVCLLNKFPVIEDHILLVTREFEEQKASLELADFEALWLCLAEGDSLAFYNSSRRAGASQRHRHLQLVPLPLDGDGAGLPIEPHLARAQFEGDRGRCASLPFVHALARLDACDPRDPAASARHSLALYRTLHDQIGAGPYNLLLTRRWMLLVPRRRAGWAGVGVNALGFAGALLVQDSEQLERVRVEEPMRILCRAGIAVG